MIYHPVIKARMKELRTSAEAALAAIPEDEYREQGAVNWGDISVREIRYWVNDLGEFGYTISLEEAAPYSQLCLTIWKKMGQPQDVEVVCEW